MGVTSWEGNDLILGQDGSDVLVGTLGDDIIDGRGGDDSIFGLDGDDLICGGGGSDTIRGGRGHDTRRGTTLSSGRTAAIRLTGELATTAWWADAASPTETTGTTFSRDVRGTISCSGELGRTSWMVGRATTAAFAARLRSTVSSTPQGRPTKKEEGGGAKPLYRESESLPSVPLDRIRVYKLLRGPGLGVGRQQLHLLFERQPALVLEQQAQRDPG